MLREVSGLLKIIQLDSGSSRIGILNILIHMRGTVYFSVPKDAMSQARNYAFEIECFQSSSFKDCVSLDHGAFRLEIHLPSAYSCLQKIRGVGKCTLSVLRETASVQSQFLGVIIPIFLTTYFILH